MLQAHQVPDYKRNHVPDYKQNHVPDYKQNHVPSYKPTGQVKTMCLATSPQDK